MHSSFARLQTLMTRRQQHAVTSSNVTKAIFVAGFLALQSAASMAADVEFVIIPATPTNPGGIQIHSSSGVVTFTTPNGQVINIAPGTNVTVSSNGQVVRSSQRTTILTFPSATTSKQAAQFLANPSQFLASNFATGGNDLAAVIEAAAADPANLQTVMNALNNANGDQQTAMGVGLAAVALAIQQTNPNYANQIQTAVAAADATGDTKVAVGYVSQTGNSQTASTGNTASSGTGGAGSGGGGGGGTGTGSIPSGGTSGTSAFTATTSVGGGGVLFTASTASFSGSASSSVSPH